MSPTCYSLDRCRAGAKSRSAWRWEANRIRLARQLLSESALLGFLGGSAGLLLASVALKVVVRLAPDGIPRLDQAGLDGRVLAFMFAVSLATGLLFGLAPALTAGRQSLNEALKGGGSPSGTLSGGRLRGGLVVAELALSLMLLAGATLLIQSLWRLESVPLGFQPAQLLTTQIMLNRYPDGQHRMAFVEGVLERVASIPGAEAVAVTTALPQRANPPTSRSRETGIPCQSPAIRQVT